MRIVEEVEVEIEQRIVTIRKAYDRYNRLAITCVYGRNQTDDCGKVDIISFKYNDHHKLIQKRVESGAYLMTKTFPKQKKIEKGLYCISFKPDMLAFPNEYNGGYISLRVDDYFYEDGELVNFIFDRKEFDKEFDKELEEESEKKENNMRVETKFEYEFDDDGNVIKKKDNHGNETHYQYDDNLFVTRSINNYGDIIEYKYDDNGNVITEADLRDNSRFEYTYDLYDNMLTKTYIEDE